MNTRRLASTWVSAGAFAAALSVAACGGGNHDAERDANPGGSDAPAAGTSGERKEGSPVTLTGCLQQGDGRNDLILTQVNEQPGPVATSGERETGAVEDKQRAAAARSYQLSGGPETLRDLVGHQVRVTGTLAEEGEVASGDNDREVSEDDLAEIEVRSAESVAETCGKPR
jgi:hypothetical protein